MSEEVRKQVRKKIKIDTFKGRNWWIGAELKSGTWYWANSNKVITYVSRIGGNGFGKYSSNPYGVMYLYQGTTGYFHYANGNCIYSLCQISQYL